ncbi:DNA-binding response OmpR family regulator [Phyllobacterium myrsinacearum]|nr:DNA-binding response OmpR family regulator [Phyllobacterium myrsinacearum]
MRNILIAEDDASIGNMLIEYFSQHDFNVSLAVNGAELKRLLAAVSPDILIVDVNLAGEDGMQIVRSAGGQTDMPVIVMSGERAPQHMSGLEPRARDYIAKPFSLRDMLTRVRGALDARLPGTAPQPTHYTFDGWQLSLSDRRLTNPAGAEIELTAHEFHLLAAFLAASRQLLAREQLLLTTRMHSGELIDPGIDTLILGLRRKLEWKELCRRYIKTQRGGGYIFDCQVGIKIAKRLQ